MRRMFTVEEIEDIGGGGGGAVSSVNGKTGNVVLSGNDIKTAPAAPGTLKDDIEEAFERIVSIESGQSEMALELSGKQDELTAGENITIENNVISASGGSGSDTFYARYGFTSYDDILDALTVCKDIWLVDGASNSRYFRLSKNNETDAEFEFAGVAEGKIWNFTVNSDGWQHYTEPAEGKVYYAEWGDLLNDLQAYIEEGYIIVYAEAGELSSYYNVEFTTPDEIHFIGFYGGNVTRFTVNAYGWQQPTSFEVEQKGNKVTSLSAASTNTQYPSAKCVYDALQGAGVGWDYIVDASHKGTTLPSTGTTGELFFLKEA